MTAHGLQSAPASASVIAVLRRVRKAQRISAEELARRITALGYPVGRSSIANMETGRRPTLTLDYAVLAAEALGTSLAAVLAGEVLCAQCKGEPHAGFTCNACGGVQ